MKGKVCKQLRGQHFFQSGDMAVEESTRKEAGCCRNENVEKDGRGDGNRIQNDRS